MEQRQRSELIETLQNRLNLCNLFANVYGKEIGLDGLQQIARAWGEDANPKLAESAGQSLLCDFARALADADLHEVRRQLAVDFAGLFLSARAQHAPPYESVYISPEHMLMQQSYNDVAWAYRREHLAGNAELREPEDHIALEFSFMAFLCQKTLDALQRGDNTTCLFYLNRQHQFLVEHLLTWTPAFCDLVIAHADTDFYRGIALLTGEFLSTERETLSELISEMCWVSDGYYYFNGVERPLP